MKSGRIQVSDGHEIYYEDCGPHEAVPFLFLHGGPGVGCFSKDKEFFDLTKQRVVFWDQRGCGRSTPLGRLKENTTTALLDDINALLDHCGIKRAVLFGGSWGATLALLYAIRNPQRILGMILRGTFLGDQSSVRYCLGEVAKHMIPEVVQRFYNVVQATTPEEALIAYSRITHDACPSHEREALSFEWLLYELSLATLRPSLTKLEEVVKMFDYLTISSLSVNYFSHKFFIEEGEIIESLERIRDIPTILVHGKYDLLSAPSASVKVKDRLAKAAFFSPCAGHSAYDEENLKVLKESVITMMNLNN